MSTLLVPDNAPPLAVTVPLALKIITPLILPEALILVRFSANGVVPPSGFWTFSAIPFTDVILLPMALVTVTVPVWFVMVKAFPALLVTSRLANVIAAAWLDPEPMSVTAEPGLVCVTVVTPKVAGLVAG